MNVIPGRMPARLRGVFAAMCVWLVLYEFAVLVGWPPRALFAGRWAHVLLLFAGATVIAVRAASFERERTAWTLIAAACYCWVAAEIFFAAVYWGVAEPPVPSASDLALLAVYPLSFAGVALLVYERTGKRDVAAWADGVIAALVTAAVASVVVFDAALSRASGGVLAQATEVAYPLGDLLLLGLVVVSFSLRGWRPDRGATLAGIGLLLFLAADSAALLSHARTTYTSGSALDALPWIGLALIALAAWTPPPAGPQRLRRESVTAPALFGATGVVVLVYGGFHRIGGLAVCFAGAALTAVLARLVISFAENQRTLRASRREAMTDALTGLGNRRRLLPELHRRCLLAYDQPFHLVLMDLNGFKLYNDRFGHPAGDTLLARLGAQLGGAMAPFGSAYRVGGDEFCVIVDAAAVKLEAVLAAARAALSESGHGFAVSASIGTAAVPAEASTASDALKIADGRLYINKDLRSEGPRDQAQSALMQLLRERHPGLHEHFSTVAVLARAVALRMRLPAERVDEIVRAAELHDLGKMAVPDSILEKPGPLTEQEWQFMRTHTVIGERILSAAPALTPIGALIRSSRERFDGCGEPDGLAGEAIPLGARVINACDAYRAMTSDRPHAPALGRDEAIAELHRAAGAQFDPDVVAVLAEVVVELSSIAPLLAAPEPVPGG